MNIGINLRKFRLLNNLSLKEAGKRLNISAPAIVKYEKGIVLPNQKRLQEFADAYNITIGELTANNKVFNIDFANLKVNTNTSSKNIFIMKELLKSKIKNYLEILNLNNYHNNFVLPKYIGITIDKIDLVSDLFRKQINVLETTIFDLTSTLENLGIAIIYFDNEYFKSFETIINNKTIIVLKYNNRLDLASSMGRLILNNEKLAYCFAKSLLMPKYQLLKDVGVKRKNICTEEIYYLSNKYKINSYTLLERLKDLEIITNSLYKKLHSIIDEKDYNNEKTYQFERLVCKLYDSNIISFNKMQEYLTSK